MGESFPPPLANLSIFNNTNYNYEDDTLTMNTADSRYLKLTGGIVSGSVTFTSGLTSNGNVNVNNFLSANNTVIINSNTTPKIKFIGSAGSYGYLDFGDETNANMAGIFASNISNALNLDYRNLSSGLLIKKSGTTQMCVATTGNVGVGTTEPIAKLQVYGQLNADFGVSASAWQSPTFLAQGAYLGWNKSSGSAETNLVTVCPNGYSGSAGIEFGNYVSSTNTYTSIGSIKPSGLTVAGKGPMKYDYGIVTTSSSSGTTNFAVTFSSNPAVVCTIINGTTGKIFVVNVSSITTSSFSWIKMYQQGGSTFNATTELFSWIAMGAG